VRDPTIRRADPTSTGAGGSTMDAVWIYMTAGSLDEARDIGRTLVEERLAACVNILEGMRSLYRWEGGVEEDEEVVLIAKTRATLVDALTDRVKTVHSYDCPCVVALPITGGNPAFLDWIGLETAPN
jgi:periplasmic divalent cation tolerance protein